MRFKGKLIKWDADKAFGFIAPNGGGSHVFIHKSAFASRNRIPQINDLLTFSITKDKNGRYCACDGTFSGEKLKKKQAENISKFSIYLSLIFLTAIITSFYLGHLPQQLMFIYLGLSTVTFVVYAFDKNKAQRKAWRTSESTLHLLALAGGWPGAALAQQYLRHKSSKQSFRNVFWVTAMTNIAIFLWLHTSSGLQYLKFFT